MILKLNRILILGIVLFLFIPELKSEINELQVTTYNNPAPGYLILAPLSIDKIAFIDNAGKVVLKKQLNIVRGGVETMDKAGNNLTFFAQDPFGGFAGFVIMNDSYQILDTCTTTSLYEIDSHDFIYLDDGSYWVLGQESRIIDMSQYVDNGRHNAIVRGFVIQKRSAGGALLFEWNTFDHFSVTDASADVDLTAADINPFHCNSICLDLDGNLLLSSRHSDEVTKINTTTGDIIWRLGGSQCRNNQFRFVNDTTYNFFGFSHQHDIRILQNGNLLMFDNGNLKPYPYSRAVEYEINESNRTIRKVWEYRHNPDLYASAQGSVQRLPNGNTLINWSRNNSSVVCTEVTSSGTIALELNDAENSFYRIRKHVFMMSANEKSINGVGSYNFNDGTSTTKTAVNYVLDTLSSSGKITFEKHNYPPHNVSFSSNTPDGFYSGRWILKNSGITRFSGIMKFVLSDIFNFASPEELTVYFRANEGNDDFSKLTSNYRSTTNTLEFRANRAGEYLIAFKELLPPALISPKDSATHRRTTQTFIWSKDKDAISYKLQLSTKDDFSQLTIDSTLADTSFTYSNLIEAKMYFWRVKTNHKTLSTSWSNSFRFTTRLISSQLNNPPNDNYIVPVKGTLEWTQNSNAKAYVVQLSKDTAFTVNIIHDTITSTYYLYKDLDYNQTYYWRVRSLADMAVSRWSDTSHFTTVLEPSKLISPKMNEENVNYNNYAFQWTKSEGALRYRLQISEEPSFDKVWDEHLDIADTVFPDDEVLKSFTNYYWRVQAFTDRNKSEWTSSSIFKTILAPPELVLPINRAVNTRTNPDLYWHSQDSSESFHIQISIDSTFKKPMIDSVGAFPNEYLCKSLKYQTTYFWRVKAVEGKSLSNWSEIWQFTTQDENFIQVPQIIYPQQGAGKIPVNLVFKWETVPGADQYDFQISNDPAFGAIMHEKKYQSNFSEEIGLKHNQIYYWRVSALKSSKKSAWSDNIKFETKLTSPQLIFPTDKELDVNVNREFRWTESDGAENYTFSLSENSSFSPDSQLVSGRNNFKPGIELKLSTQYFWRVMATSLSNESEWSVPQSFTTDDFNSAFETAEQSLSVYPNIFSDEINIHFTNFSNISVQLEITDITGIVVLHEQVEISNQNNIKLSCGMLPSGMYYLKMKSFYYKQIIPLIKVN